LAHRMVMSGRSMRVGKERESKTLILQFVPSSILECFFGMSTLSLWEIDEEIGTGGPHWDRIQRSRQGKGLKKIIHPTSAVFHPNTTVHKPALLL
jgi:hypothetical protein